MQILFSRLETLAQLVELVSQVQHGELKRLCVLPQPFALN